MKLSDIAAQPDQPMKLSDIQAGPPPGPMQYDPSMPHRVGEMFKGMPGGFLGTPGDIEAAGRAPLHALFPKQVSREPVLPTAKEITESEFGPAKTPEDTNARELGAFIGGAAVPFAAGKAVKGLGKAGSIARDLWPGATRRGIGLIDRIAKPAADMTEIGKPLQQYLIERLDKLKAARTAQFAPFKDALFKTDPTTAETVRKNILWYLGQKLGEAKTSHLSSADKLIEAGINEITTRPLDLQGIDELRRFFGKAAEGEAEGFTGVKIALGSDLKEGVEKAMESVPAFKPYLSKWRELSAPINEFEGKLGRFATDTEGGYAADIKKADPADVVRRAFRTNTSVEDLTKLVGGNKEFVNDMAREVVATDLNQVVSTAARGTGGAPYYGPAQNIANAARKWLDSKTVKGWLNAVPEVRDETEEYVSNLERIASRRKKAAYVGGGVALYELLQHGRMPLNWARHFIGLP